MKSLIIAALFFFHVQASAEVICECTKVWKGGPMAFFYGYRINAGSVSGRNRSAAIEMCRGTGRVLFYNPLVTNCN